MSDHNMELDSKSQPEAMDILHDEAKVIVVEKVLAVKPRYLGIYAPGDFNMQTYRLVIPDSSCPKPGRGYHGIREEVILETSDRSEIEQLIAQIKQLSKVPGGPVAVRHILNVDSGKDEGIRIVWANRDGLVEDGEEEMADWPRRDKMIKEGQAVLPELGTVAWAEGAMFPPFVGIGMGWGMPMAMPFGQLPPLLTGHLSAVSTPIMSPLTPISAVPGYEPYPAMQVDQAPWCAAEGYLAPTK